MPTSHYTIAIFTCDVLFPLDCRWWFRRDVVANAIDSFNLINDVVRDFCHEFVG